MKGLGVLLLIAGLLLVGGAFLIDTSVSTSLVIGPGEVSNLSLLQQQQLVFTGGCALFVAGVSLIAAGEVVEAVRTMRSVDTRDAAPAPSGGGEPQWQTPASPAEQRIVISLIIGSMAAVIGYVVYAASGL